MDKDQAAGILDHLLAAARELDEARAAADALADHDKDAAALRDITTRLNSELLQTLFQRFPDMLPFDESPGISSSRRWGQVLLPPSVSEAQVDEIIHSCMKPLWQKTAMVVAKATARSKETGLPLGHQIIAARIAALAEAGIIDNQGDVRKWRLSEVRAKN